MELLAISQISANGTQVAIAVALLITYIIYGAVYILNIFHPIAPVTISTHFFLILLKERKLTERNLCY